MKDYLTLIIVFLISQTKNLEKNLWPHKKQKNRKEFKLRYRQKTPKIRVKKEPKKMPKTPKRGPKKEQKAQTQRDSSESVSGPSTPPSEPYPLTLMLQSKSSSSEIVCNYTKKN